MREWRADPRDRTDVVTIPRLWLTFAASVLVHLVALFIVLPQLPLLAPGDAEKQVSDRLEVRIAEAPAPVPTQLPPPPPPSRQSRTILTARPRPRNAPPRESPPEFVMPTQEPPEPPPPQTTPPPVAEQKPAPPPVESDLASYVEARRQARGEPSSSSNPVETENERRDRIIASNMPTARSPMDNNQRKRGGGVFEITRMTYDDAEFRFFGWSKDVSRKVNQNYEVRLGTNADMQIAVVRRIIAIIREHEPGDFTWDSWRLGHVITLSARASDSAGLEEFLMHEFFDPAPTSRSSFR